MNLTERQQKVAVECILFCFFNPGDKTAVKARCLSALHSLHLNPEIAGCLPPTRNTSSSGLDVLT